MFVSKELLTKEFGTDREIAAFFIDRPVPENNAYWRKHTLYIPPMDGYIFIPVYADLMFRIGLPKEKVISEEYIQLTEAIAHSSAKMELHGMPYDEHVRECVEIMQPFDRNGELTEDLKKYFGLPNEAKDIYKLGSGFKPLDRADTFLFSLSYFEEPGRDMMQKLLDAWYAVITYYLVIDDIVDFVKDMDKDSEENVFKDTGADSRGFGIIDSLLKKDAETVRPYNQVLADFMGKSRQNWMQEGKIKQFIKVLNI